MRVFVVLLAAASWSAAEEVGNETTSFGGMLEGVESEIMDLAKRSGHSPESLRDHLEAFATAINWKEPWIRALLATHATLWVTFVLTRRWHYFQFALFILITALVATAEPLNTYCRDRWRVFATQNYFDEHGVFAAVLYSGPLLALGLVMMFNFIAQSANLLVDVKREQFKEEARKRAAAAAKKDD
mmetsp:Transcript_19839/g.62458  ORF Transcript_19839/g.62458 Transcript_19839/m.62458 type:complete len:186 (+) Transcript_19839:1176-1733(+)